MVAAAAIAAFTWGTSLVTASHQSRAEAAASPNTSITVNGNGGDKTFQGIGAVLGGGGNARYLMDYPDPERSQILDYLFKPDYGASLQVLKLEIGGGTNSSDGAEASIEPKQGQINCDAGYEFAIAKQAQERNPGIALYGLQWTAPSWVYTSSANPTTPSVFTSDDISYLIDWLNCATNTWGLTVSYLGGWNEHAGADPGWFDDLKAALTSAGYGSIKLVAGDNKWEYASSPADSNISVLGAHDICGSPTEQITSGVPSVCAGPSAADTTAAFNAGQSLWASELGMMDAGAETGCTIPCAPAMDRALVRGYHEASLTGYLEWPVLDAMPQTGNQEDNTPLPFENRGLITADQPWSGFYSVRAMTWAIAQFTQFVTPPTATDPGWRYEDTSSGYLQGSKADGAYVTLIHNGGDGWTTVIDTTSASAQQQVTLTVSGGASGLASHVVHVWSSNFDFSSPFDTSANWMLHRQDITPSGGTFTLSLQPGFVYTLSTTEPAGQGARSASPPAQANFPMPYNSTADLASAGPAAGDDDEPAYLDAQDGSFEVVQCQVQFGANTTCTGQTTAGTTSAPPVFWHPDDSAVRYPYAIIGDGSLANYTVSVETLFTGMSDTSGVIGRFTNRFVGKDAPDQLSIGYFAGYVFDVSATGTWKLISNSIAGPATLATGSVGVLGTGTWVKLSLTMSGSTISASVNGTQVTSKTDTSETAGLAGIEAGFTNADSDNWPQVQYSNLSITTP